MVRWVPERKLTLAAACIKALSPFIPEPSVKTDAGLVLCSRGLSRGCREATAYSIMHTRHVAAEHVTAAPHVVSFISWAYS